MDALEGRQGCEGGGCEGGVPVVPLVGVAEAFVEEGELGYEVAICGGDEFGEPAE